MNDRLKSVRSNAVFALQCSMLVEHLSHDGMTVGLAQRTADNAMHAFECAEHATSDDERDTCVASADNLADTASELLTRAIHERTLRESCDA